MHLPNLLIASSYYPLLRLYFDLELKDEVLEHLMIGLQDRHLHEKVINIEKIVFLMRMLI